MQAFRCLALRLTPCPRWMTRAADAEAVLQLAREVHRHADMGLAARFRQRFAFAPDALAAHAHRAGQPAGPLLLLGDDRAVVRVACGGGARHALVAVAGLQATVVEGLHGAGVPQPAMLCQVRRSPSHHPRGLGWAGDHPLAPAPPRQSRKAGDCR